MSFPSPGRILAACSLALVVRAGDSRAELEQKIQRAQGRERTELLLNLADRCLQEDPHQALKPAEEALALAEALKAVKDQVRARIQIARVRQALGDFPGALALLEQAEAQAQKAGDASGQARCLLERSVIAQRQGNHAVSLELAYRSLQMEERLGDPSRVAACLNIIGGDHFRQKQFAEAEKAWERALEVFAGAGNLRGQAYILNNLGILSTQRKDYRGARQRLERAMELRRQLGDRLGMAELYNNLAPLLIELGEKVRGEAYYRKAFDLKKEAGDSFGLVTTANNLADLAISRQRWQEAHAWLAEARGHAERAKSAHLLAGCYQMEAELAEKEGKLSLALDWQRKLLAVKEQIYTESVAKRVAEAGVRYEVEKKEQAIELLKRDQALRKARVRLYLLGYGALAAVLLLLLNRYRSRLRNERKLQAKNAELERLNLQKTEFLGIVAHDLRNPITGMVLVAESMVGETDLKQMWADASALKDQGVALNQLLGRYLRLTAIESGKLNADPEPFPLRELVNEMIFQWVRQSEHKEICLLPLESADPAYVMADPAFIRQVLDNLISNAVKYSPKGSRVSFSITNSGDMQVLTVEDEGPGVPEADRERIFDRFTRLSATPTGGESSTGLGLSIVKLMVEACGGRVWVEAAPGGGAAFKVALPAANLEPLQ